ncbi:MAG: mRNA interferase HigB [Thermoproteota archaeon]|jgi:mRNA interferase HigB
MVVISKTVLNEFGQSHADVISALNDWYSCVKDSEWNSFSDIKNTFGSTDYVGNDRYVFNIKGNKYRLIAMIFFDIRTVFIRYIGTHAEYDKIKDCSEV